MVGRMHGADRPVTDGSDVIDASIDAFRAAMAATDFLRADTIAALLPREDLRRALRGLTPVLVEALYEALGDERLASLLQELAPTDAADLLCQLLDVEAADVLDELAPDDAADVLGAIKAEAPERTHPIL